jgi:hypothetical protein
MQRCANAFCFSLRVAASADEHPAYAPPRPRSRLLMVSQLFSQFEYRVRTRVALAGGSFPP